MEKEKIDRINFLAKKSKSETLTDEEKREQELLRNEYRTSFRESFKAQLDQVYTVDPDGKKIKLIKE
ncbi:MAG: DUF896 domain-containing protein [Bacteroides sp.]|nr:DUF896 domain-containing protein [Eubacterium sp.]MCM1417309.1 DUF896 domain-containing protein [Roseburia sp.]MCM1461071.1 DUF896 domain-containing protein [Bacteroides sp.]